MRWERNLSPRHRSKLPDLPIFTHLESLDFPIEEGAVILTGAVSPTLSVYIRGSYGSVMEISNRIKEME
ncbi:XXYS1_4_G0011650.mRNA.1.CDS.1 [Saccharomyces cerevisiae]|nr:XXYS1_4_G0051550.mRNA.1.CDS.1 [Saccharomyces cerevisiae]CAD6633180.1 XXYS1_4_G0011650.mRNA.1.CDS.1 [Saccharomyces cerevisiae]